MFLISPTAPVERPVWRDMTPRARTLARTLVTEPNADLPFDPAAITTLPEPARRWLTHAIAPGTPPITAAELQMHGQIRLGFWRDFTATQALVPDDGFVWAARTRLAGVPVRGYDSYVDGHGRSHWRVLGCLPLVATHGADTTLSAADRLAAECVLLPPTLLHATWRPGPGTDAATFMRRIGRRHWHESAVIQVADDGRLRKVSMQRWGRPPGTQFGLYGFEVSFDGEYVADGVRVGDAMRAAWIYPDGRRHEFYRAWLDSVHFFLPGGPS